MSTGRSVPSVASDPLAAVVHLRIEQLRREAEDHRLVRDARLARMAVRPRRTAFPWPATVAAALRDSLTGRPASQPGTDPVRPDHGSAVCSA
ncbi:MAG TPA: hypothetical protein VKB14_07995 [Actinomycetales bacterium]|nr:hypothetical protein [Actinomycetales bacterium]